MLQVLAWIALAAIIGTQVMMVQGNPQGFQNQADFLGAAAGGGRARSSRGVGIPPRTPARPIRRR